LVHFVFISSLGNMYQENLATLVAKMANLITWLWVRIPSIRWNSLNFFFSLHKARRSIQTFLLCLFFMLPIGLLTC
jgi:hypothetical protein